MNIRKLALALLLFASPAFAADIDGDWSGSIDTPGGAMQISYTFKAEQSKLKGSTTAPDGSKIAIADGKIDGNKLSFTLTLDFGAGPTKFVYTGELNGKDLKLATSFMDMPIEMQLKKS